MSNLAIRGKYAAFSRLKGCLFLVLGAVLLLVFTGCGSDSDSNIQSIAQDERSKAVYLTNGNPHDIISGARLEKQSFITPGKVEKFNGFGILATRTFFEKRLKTAPVNPEVGEKPQISKSQSVRVHRFKKLSQTEYIYTNEDSASDLVFQLRGGRLHWEKAFGHNIEALHYSFNEDTPNRFSLLGSYEDPAQGTVLLNLVFFNPEVKPEFSRLFLKQSEKIYNYLFGPNVIARWKDSKTISLCGEVPKTFKSEISNAVEAWQNVLDDELKLNVKIQDSYPPFSDLNTSCIYWVNDFIVDSHDEYMFLGRTVFSAYLPDGEIIDSDIFMFEKEFVRLKDLNPDEVAGARKRTLLHELGHLLGLHHVFDGTESIMSYDSKVRTITDFDREALRALYRN